MLKPFQASVLELCRTASFPPRSESSRMINLVRLSIDVGNRINLCGVHLSLAFARAEEIVKWSPTQRKAAYLPQGNRGEGYILGPHVCHIGPKGVAGLSVQAPNFLSSPISCSLCCQIETARGICILVRFFEPFKIFA